MKWGEHHDSDGNTYWRAKSDHKPDEFGRAQYWQVEPRLVKNAIAWTLEASCEGLLDFCDPEMEMDGAAWDTAAEAKEYAEGVERMSVAVMKGQADE